MFFIQIAQSSKVTCYNSPCSFCCGLHKKFLAKDAYLKVTVLHHILWWNSHFLKTKQSLIYLENTDVHQLPGFEQPQAWQFLTVETRSHDCIFEYSETGQRQLFDWREALLPALCVTAGPSLRYVKIKSLCLTAGLIRFVRSPASNAYYDPRLMTDSAAAWRQNCEDENGPFSLLAIHVSDRGKRSLKGILPSSHFTRE